MGGGRGEGIPFSPLGRRESRCKAHTCTPIPTPCITQIDLGNGRELPLLKFRGQTRFVILAGSKGFIEKSIKEAEEYYLPLRERGVSGGWGGDSS